MKRYTNTFGSVIIRTLELAILLTVPLTTTVFCTPMPIHIDVMGNPETIGTIEIHVDTSDHNEGLEGGFNVTMENEDGTTMTIDELEAYLGQDHLNWFQKVTSDNKPPKDAGGNTLDPPYIDPPNGGYSNQWADDAPWYWDEDEPPEGGGTGWDASYLLANNVSGSTLSFEDYPGGPIGTQVSFVTFLISDYGNETYLPLAGFSWEMEVGDDGYTDITSLTGDAEWSKEYCKEIKDEFGYSQVPEASTLLLFGSGLAGILGFCKRRVLNRFTNGSG